MWGGVTLGSKAPTLWYRWFLTEAGATSYARGRYALTRIHRRTPMDGVRTAEGGG